MIDCGINRTSRAIESLANGPHETASGHRNRRWPPSRCYEWPPTVSQFAPDGRPDPGCGHAASIPASILLDGVGISLLSSSSASLTASSSSPLSAFCRRAERRCRWGRALWSGILWRVRITPPSPPSLPPDPCHLSPPLVSKGWLCGVWNGCTEVFRIFCVHLPCNFVCLRSSVSKSRFDWI